jgi:hypothetical protein
MVQYHSISFPIGKILYEQTEHLLNIFHYRNAPDHVQPFVLAQFKKLPLDRFISVTCRAWAPNMEHDTRAMRGMVNFQLYRSHKMSRSNDDNY